MVFRKRSGDEKAVNAGEIIFRSDCGSFAWPTRRQSPKNFTFSTMQPNRTGNQEGIFLRRWTRQEGLFFDEFSTDSAWIREKAKVYFPSLPKIKEIVIRGEYQRHPEVG